MNRFVYKQSEREGEAIRDFFTGKIVSRMVGNLWAVGHYDPNGKFIPESDHESAEEAAKQCHYLNGGVEAEATAVTVERTPEAKLDASLAANGEMQASIQKTMDNLQEEQSSQLCHFSSTEGE